MDKNILRLIADGEYNYDTHTSDTTASVALGYPERIQLFDEACHVATKILGRSQDRDSKTRIGSLMKTESRKRNLALDARRFTTPIPIGIFGSGDEELYSRVTVTERFGRSMQQKPFHTLGYGSVAVKLFFLSTPEDQEQEAHRAICKRTGDDITTQIDSFNPSRGRGLSHVVQLLELTQNSLR